MATLIVAVADLAFKLLAALRPDDCARTKRIAAWGGVLVGLSMVALTASGLLSHSLFE